MCQRQQLEKMNRKNTLLYRILTVVLSGLATPCFSASLAEGEDASIATPMQIIPYVSLRNLTGEEAPEDRFGDERDAIRHGQCVLSHESSWNFPKSLSDNGLFYVPKNDIKLKAVEISTAEGFWRTMSRQADGRNPVLYLHGYNTSFAKSCEQASLFQEKLSLEGRLVLFSWPSDGALLNYARDEADLSWSVAPLESTLLKMIETFGNGQVDVIAHSLGARGLFMSLIQLAHDTGRSLPLLNQLVFTAPDIDAEVFQQYLQGIRPLARHITLYVSENDRPLALSREVHGYPRLGEAGSHLDEIEGIDIIDLSGVGVVSFSGHLYHLYHDKVAHDLDLLLNHGVSARNRMGLVPAGKDRWQIVRPDPN